MVDLLPDDGARVSVAQVARRYAVNANLIFKWLRDPRFAPDATVVPSHAVEPHFLPVEIVGEAEAKSPVAMSAAENHIEIELAGGYRMRISGSYDPEARSRLIRRAVLYWRFKMAKSI